jgi:hypothetical protein
VNNALAPRSVSVAIQDLNEISCSAVSTGGSNNGSLKLFPVLIQYFHKIRGIKSQLIDLNSIPNEKSETTANCVTQTFKDHGLRTECFAFSGGNMNTNFGVINRSTKKVSSVLQIMNQRKTSPLLYVSTHPSQVSTAWSSYFVWDTVHRNEEIQLFFSIYTKNTRSQELA